MNNDYIASEYRRLHEAGKFSGGCLGRYIPEIKKLIEEHDCKTVLDYGCGKASAHKKNKLTDSVTLYDPYYAPYSKEPEGTFDMVICTDVLEHIPLSGENNAFVVLERLIAMADKVLFMSISTQPARKTFANGQNVHLTIMSKETWDFHIRTLNKKNIKIVTHYTKE